jgi:hypothetical protein
MLTKETQATRATDLQNAVSEESPLSGLWLVTNTCLLQRAVMCIQSFVFAEIKRSQVPVAHACNPSFLGGRNQKDGGLKPAQANSSRDTFLKKPNTK